MMAVSAFLLSRAGRYRAAETQLAESIQAAERFEDRFNSGQASYFGALFAVEQQEYAAALQHLQRGDAMVADVAVPLFRANLQVSIRLLAGVVEARRGDVAAARRELERFRTAYLEEHIPHVLLLRCLEGEIALAAGDLPAAEAGFTAAQPQFKPMLTGSGGLLVNHPPCRDGLARVRVARGDVAGAIAIYRQLLTPDISSKWTSMLEPRYVLALARLLDRAGDRAAARTEYQRFLDLWKNADSGLPELAEARRALGSA
jgi:tetratricopeptide (TPR) repeat protein